MPDLLQQIFNKGVEGIIKQGEHAYDDENSECLYRYGNLKCHIGHCIKDEYYNTSIESTGVYAESVVEILALSMGVTDDDIMPLRSNLEKIQSAHDDSACEVNPLEAWANRLIPLAESLDLTIPADLLALQGDTP